MPRPAIARDEFGQLTRSLAVEIQSATIDYTMYENLAKAADAHLDVVTQSRAFWDLTISSHLNSAILRLCRVYDQQVSSMNLAKWLRLIKGNTSWFTRSSLDLGKLDEHIAYASNKNILVKNLTLFRGNVVAHIGQNYVLNYRDTQNSFKLTHGNLKELLKRGLKILNLYSAAFDGNAWSGDLIGADDYKFVFRELKLAVKRHKQRFIEEQQS